jgi:hypothetical protein
MHMNYADYQAYKGGVGDRARIIDEIFGYPDNLKFMRQ